MALTTDFTGTYNYAREEAENEARHYLGLIADADNDKDELSYIQRAIGKLAAHWGKVFDGPDEYEEFSSAFNAMMPDMDYFI